MKGAIYSRVSTEQQDYSKQKNQDSIIIDQSLKN